MEGLTPEQMQQMQQQCIFCHIVNGQVSAKKIYEDDKVIAVLDINPANPGHILVITKEHYMVMPQIPDEIVEHIGMIAKALSHVLLRALKAEGTTIFIANGISAGQRAQHFMLHIIPRMEKDGVGIVIPQKDMSEEDFKKVRTALISGVEKHLGKVEGLEVEEEPEKVEEKKSDEKESEKAPEEVKEKESDEKPKEVEEKEEETAEEDKKPNLDDIAGLFK